MRRKLGAAIDCSASPRRRKAFSSGDITLGATQHGHVLERPSVVVRRAQPLGHPVGFSARVVGQHQHRHRAAPAGTGRLHQLQLVVTSHIGIAEQALRAVQCQRQHLGRIAVVQPQDAGAAARLDADARKVEFSPARLVDALCIVVQHQQAACFRADHARCDAQPGVVEVMRLVDQQRQVLACGHTAVVDRTLDHAGQRFEVASPLSPAVPSS
jgi:hypothetical protein